jgi:hypothetical protein
LDKSETASEDEIVEAHGKKKKRGRPRKIQGVIKKTQSRKRDISETTSDDSDNSDIGVASSWGSTATSRKREFSDEKRKTSNEGIMKHEKNQEISEGNCGVLKYSKKPAI